MEEDYIWRCDAPGTTIHCWRRVRAHGARPSFDSLCGVGDPDRDAAHPTAGVTICESCARTAHRYGMPQIPADAGSERAQAPILACVCGVRPR
jgi:hypothetical protein